MVDLEGFEPSTSSMPWKRAPNCATGPRKQQLRLAYHEPGAGLADHGAHGRSGGDFSGQLYERSALFAWLASMISPSKR